jgi:hypothetical protein
LNSSPVPRIVREGIKEIDGRGEFNYVKAFQK